LGVEYARLGEAIHAARDDAELFKSALGKVEGHFDAKAMFERRSGR
jgi:hypothetical protein